MKKVSMNAMKTTLLLGLLSGLLIIGGGALAGDRGLFTVWFWQSP
jgi:hypothetical protein